MRRVFIVVLAVFSAVISVITPAKAGDMWSKASPHAVPELRVAQSAKLIPAILDGADLTRPITRAEFAALAVRLYGKEPAAMAANPFIDTRDPEVLKACSLGFVTGAEADRFAPALPVSRELAAAILVRVVKRFTIPDWSLEADGYYTLNFTMPQPFADDADISPWARTSVYFAVASGIMPPLYGDTFVPDNKTPEEKRRHYANPTREEAIACAVRVLRNLGGAKLSYTTVRQPGRPVAEPIRPPEPPERPDRPDRRHRQSPEAAAILGEWTHNWAGLGTYGYRTPTYTWNRGAYYVSSYTFNPDGTFIHFAMGSGSVINGNVRTAGRYRLEGNRIYFTDQTATWVDLFNERNSYTNKPQQDSMKYFIFRKTENGELELAIDYSEDFTNSSNWHKRGGLKK